MRRKEPVGSIPAEILPRSAVVLWERWLFHLKRASIIRTRPEPILLAVDSGGTGAFRMHPDHPTLVCHAGPPMELMLWGPSTLVAGEEMELKLAVVDFNANPTPVDGEVSLRTTKGKVKLASRVPFRSNDGRIMMLICAIVL